MQRDCWMEETREGRTARLAGVGTGPVAEVGVESVAFCRRKSRECSGIVRKCRQRLAILSIWRFFSPLLV